MPAPKNWSRFKQTKA